MIDLILGTAGHIDHGKTSLVKALTGVDTDRLPEEKLRGITIDLGFAELVLGEVRLGIVDVPGHERFVRNMLAGATGIDLAMLVVAADDSVKPQTREHLEILRLLDLEHGVIALTKCDLPDPDWIDLVEAEVRELVQDSFLAAAPIVRTSVPTGLGVEALKASLTEAAGRVAHSARVGRRHSPFRLAIDRTFTVAGHGTVVTGSVASGSSQVGDSLVIEPGGVAVRVRGLQNHDRQCAEIHRGQRAAINLAGVHHDEVQRGQELAAAGYLRPSRAISAKVRLAETAPRPLKNRAQVRVHLGTAELMASLVLLGEERLEPGGDALIQLYLSEPAVSTWGQPLVLRSESPVMTIGGGTVLNPNAPKLPRHDADVLARLAALTSAEPLQRAAAALSFIGLADWQAADLVRAAGIDHPAAVVDELLQSGQLVPLVVSHGRELRVERRWLDDVFRRIESILKQQHAEFPLRTVLDRSRLVHRLAYLGEEPVVEAILAAMSRAGRLTIGDRGVALPGHGPQLSKNEQKLLADIIDTFCTSGYEPPTVEEIRGRTTKNQQSVEQLVALAAAEGQLVEIGGGLFLHAEVEHRLRETLVAEMSAGQGRTVSQIRELLGTTRKYAVPLCEYLDRSGFTRREGDMRYLANFWPQGGQK
ncbi:MAG TPA: selenocysteine-specific translation elongation factor [Pirellulales bacterium]|jgi:selenocysteine-specific elongation factor|nr:selenocysteine-specific translation elongation factor [Pirellulales bacterium]